MKDQRQGEAVPLVGESGLKLLHTFRSKVLGLTAFQDRLWIATERGIYVMDKNGKRYRKVKIQ